MHWPDGEMIAGFCQSNIPRSIHNNRSTTHRHLGDLLVTGKLLAVIEGTFLITSVTLDTSLSGTRISRL